MRLTVVGEELRPRITTLGGGTGWGTELAYFYSRAFRFATRWRGGGKGRGVLPYVPMGPGGGRPLIRLACGQPPSPRGRLFLGGRTALQAAHVPYRAQQQPPGQRLAKRKARKEEPVEHW